MRERGALNILLVIVAGAPLVLTIVNFILAQGNQSLRTELARRQHMIAEGGQLTRASQLLIREIAVAAIKSKDSQLRELLARNGVTIRVSPTPAPENGKGE